MQQRSRQSASIPDDAPIARWYQLHALSLMAYVRQHVPSREDAEAMERALEDYEKI